MWALRITVILLFTVAVAADSSLPKAVQPSNEPLVLWPIPGSFFASDTLFVILLLPNGMNGTSITINGTIEGTFTTTGQQNNHMFVDLSPYPEYGPIDVDFFVTYGDGVDSELIPWSFTFQPPSQGDLQYVFPNGDTDKFVNAIGSTLFNVSRSSESMIYYVTFNVLFFLPPADKVSLTLWSNPVLPTDNFFVYEQGFTYNAMNTLYAWVTGIDSRDGIARTASVKLLSNFCGDGKCADVTYGNFPTFHEDCNTCAVDCCPTIPNPVNVIPQTSLEQVIVPLPGSTIYSQTSTGFYYVLIALASEDSQPKEAISYILSQGVVDLHHFSWDFQVGYLLLELQAPPVSGPVSFSVTVLYMDGSVSVEIPIYFYYSKENPALSFNVADNGFIPTQGTFLANVTRDPNKGMSNNATFFALFVGGNSTVTPQTSFQLEFFLEVSEPILVDAEDTYSYNYFVDTTPGPGLYAWAVALDSNNKPYYVQDYLFPTFCGDGICSPLYFDYEYYWETFYETSENCPFDCFTYGTPPTQIPTTPPTATPQPTRPPTGPPTKPPPTKLPSPAPTSTATPIPTPNPTSSPTTAPTTTPTSAPTIMPTVPPTIIPTAVPTVIPTSPPTKTPTTSPTIPPTRSPTAAPTKTPTNAPTDKPTPKPTVSPIRCNYDGVCDASENCTCSDCGSCPMVIINRNSGRVVTATSLISGATINLTSYDSKVGPNMYQAWVFDNVTGHVSLRAYPNMIVGGGPAVEALPSSQTSISFAFKTALLDITQYPQPVNQWTLVHLSGTGSSAYYGIANRQFSDNSGSWWDAPYPNTPANEPGAQLWSAPLVSGAYVQEFQLVSFVCHTC